MGHNILVVDDEPTILQALQGILSDEGFEVLQAADGAEAIALVEESLPDLVLLDIWMPNMDGLTTLERLKADYPYLPVVMMSGAGTIETAVKATKLGAYDYIEKPLSYEKIIVTLTNALSFGQLAEENRLLRQKTLPATQLTGRSKTIEKVRRQIDLVAPTTAWVLITGDNGTGKEVAAHMIHAKSSRSDRPMVEVNCAAIPEELIESELFGHEKGSFTGAQERRRGKFDLAHHGTLFLDEIADMSLRTQAKILRILQEQKFERVGGARTISVDVRVIAATNRDLEEEIRRGNFRQDLYFRLHVIPIHLPALEERPEDVADLAAEFLAEFSRSTKDEPKRLTDAALEALSRYSWPGNVRELKNLIERLVILTPGEEIDLKDLPEPYGPAGKAPQARAAVSESSLKEARAAFERNYILETLNRNDHNISAAAEALGIERSHLYKKMKSLGITSGEREAD